MVSVMWAEVLAEARKGFAKKKAALEARCRKSERNIAIRELSVASGIAAADAAVHARHADLSIMLRPGGSKPIDYRNAIFEGVLFGSGRPVLLAPPGTPLYELDDNYFHNPAAWQTLLAALDRLAATQQQRGDCTVLLIHPQIHFLNALHPYQRHYDAIEQAAHERGLFAVRAVDDFLGRKDRELWASANDAHPGPQAHSLLALRLLRELSALPARCRVPALAADGARG